MVYASVADPGSKKLAKTMENIYKNQPKSYRISYIFLENIKLLFNDINVYPINNKKISYFGKINFYRKKSKTKVGIFVDFRSDSEPYQNDTDP